MNTLERLAGAAGIVFGSTNCGGFGPEGDRCLRWLAASDAMRPDLAAIRVWPRRLAPAILALSSIASGACREPALKHPTFFIRDSAGIQILESAAPAWTDQEVWRVDPNPLVDLSEGEDPQLFRVTSPRQLPVGRIAVFAGGSCEVRIYDGERLVRALGRCGEGPGEFGTYASLSYWPGHGLLVNESPVRVTVIDAQGTIQRTAAIIGGRELPLPYLNGVLSDGILVLSGLRDPGARARSGVDTARLTLGLSPGLGDTMRVIGTYDGPVYRYEEFRGRIGRSVLPFSSATEIAAGGDRVFVAFPAQNEIRVLRQDGSVERILRRPIVANQVTQADIDWLMDRRLAEVEGSDSKRLVRQAFRHLQYANQMPSFGVPRWTSGLEAGGPVMLEDRKGNLWVFDYYRPGSYRSRFSVFSPEGVWLGGVDLPDGFRPSEIVGDFLLGVWTDDIGFRHVLKLRLVKP